MKHSFLIRTAIILLTLNVAVMAEPPLKQAINHLSRAKAALERPNVLNEKRNENAVGTQLDLALTQIGEIKVNKGSHLPLAEKAVKAAQAEMAAGDDATHRAAATTQVDEAIKQLDKAWNVHH